MIGHWTLRHWTLRPVVAFLCIWALSAGAARADWLTGRGNNERTGCQDDRGGPNEPKVLWVYKAREDFIASPVVGANRLFASSLAGFNTAAFHALTMDPPDAGRIVFSKGAPFIKLPTVCSPVIVGGLVIFGDGMHQTDGAILYCLRESTGLPVWQLSVPGKLVHMEGAPAVANGRVYAVGGEAGILCVDIKTLTLDGKPSNVDAASAAIQAKWAELLAKYEEDRKKNGDLAIPPSEDALPKAVPKILWQKGQALWHVDAPITVAGERVLAASARVEADKVGKSCLVCLNAADGSTVWEVPLPVNPWAGASVSGNLAVVGCSSVRFERKLIPQAKGQVLAVQVSDGKIAWQRDVPGGVLAPAALKNGLAVFTATDGKVRAFDLASGKDRWTYDAGAPFFGGPALAADTVYAADLAGNLHAVMLADGKKKWVLSLPADVAVQAPGGCYGSPVVHGGQIYLATSNLESDHADKPCGVLCVGEKAAASIAALSAPIEINQSAGTVAIVCRVAPRKLPHLKEIYPIEVMATLPHPRGQKAHETIVTFDSKPSDVHKALEQLGLKAGQPARGEGPPATGPAVRFFLELPGVNGKRRLVNIERTLIDRRTGRVLAPLVWHFTGSALRQPDPSKETRVYGADMGGTLIALFPVTDECVFQSNLTMREELLLKLDTNTSLLPPEGTPGRLIIQIVK